MGWSETSRNRSKLCLVKTTWMAGRSVSAPMSPKLLHVRRIFLRSTRSSLANVYRASSWGSFSSSAILMLALSDSQASDTRLPNLSRPRLLPRCPVLLVFMSGAFLALGRLPRHAGVLRQAGCWEETPLLYGGAFGSLRTHHKNFFA